MESTPYVFESNKIANFSSSLVMENGVKNSQGEIITQLKASRFPLVP